MINKEIAIEFIKLIPPMSLILIVCLILFRYRQAIGELLSRIGSVKAFGVEAVFAEAREQLIQATKSYQLSSNEKEIQAVIERANRIHHLLQGSRILWVDDQFLANANIYRFLNSYGVMIDEAATTDEALTALKWAAGAYEVVVSDMVRGDDMTAGIDLLNRMTSLNFQKPVILFVSTLNPKKGTPAGAVAITDSPIKLIHYIMNVIDGGG